MGFGADFRAENGVNSVYAATRWFLMETENDQKTMPRARVACDSEPGFSRAGSEARTEVAKLPR